MVHFRNSQAYFELDIVNDVVTGYRYQNLTSKILYVHIWKKSDVNIKIQFQANPGTSFTTKTLDGILKDAIYREDSGFDTVKNRNEKAFLDWKFVYRLGGGQ
jgi:hypothetical protein